MVPFYDTDLYHGREMMNHTFDENNIFYQMYDNSFFKISNIDMAQELADRFNSKALCRQLDLLPIK